MWHVPISRLPGHFWQFSNKDSELLLFVIVAAFALRTLHIFFPHFLAASWLVVLMACFFFFLSFCTLPPSLNTAASSTVHPCVLLVHVPVPWCVLISDSCVCCTRVCVFVGCGLCDAAAGFGACALPACETLFHSPAILGAHAVAQPQLKAKWHLPARHRGTKPSTKQQNSDAPSQAQRVRKAPAEH